jgi:SAM-dependent methyltransferase
MTAISPRRERFDGVAQILRFNWDFYALASALIVAASLAISRPALAPALRLLIECAAATAGISILGSIFVSYWIYDLSKLMRWQWIRDALRFQPRAWVNIHSGLDESTPALRELFPHAAWRVLDIYDEREMTERSIRRARRLARNEFVAEPADFRRLPVKDAEVDAGFLLLSAHELRTKSSRDAFFGELNRILAPGGRMVLVEHLRDLANAIAFGPGALHFHSRCTWLRTFEYAGFAVADEFKITPFVRVFILRRSL